MRQVSRPALDKAAFLGMKAGVPLPVGFRNPIALRIAFLMSVGTMLAQITPGVQLLLPFWWLAAGWGAVALYRRVTGFAINVRAGARLGSITGIFASLTVIVSIAMLFAEKDTFAQMLKQNPQLAPVAGDRAQLTIVILMVLALSFATVVGLCAAGGALGARFAGRGANGSPAR